MIVEDQEQDLTEIFDLPSLTTLVLPRSTPYTFSKQQIRTIKLRSGAQH
ncbi:uncharacterized protein PGTG_09761 [Puccinia graminis f. sp. tritici CRL 75-36-700-3]|uniref:Uncharacterized protein n=1 Tax=Puccinia graminis f. sp. tritici (strain CRL 75-36-700-3 / race SCCL) TaxID=418459 RepID=E3KIC3_PUCGT|nr:uncharacterized protein PGTG_09761 [Puccinia graminis f. sp. tritici CRL 75-36-700-3]EFP84048.1 hypothetical protein PGTG_09761 [Puccinia graminis f. sp. tritici CRL 75-36-700-3]